MSNTKKYAYYCAICGNGFDEIKDRANCEMECLKKKAEEERAAVEAKKKEEKNTRQDEVTAALDNAFALVNKYIEDYGSYRYNGKLKELDAANMDFFPSKLWHHFWF